MSYKKAILVLLTVLALGIALAQEPEEPAGPTPNFLSPVSAAMRRGENQEAARLLKAMDLKALSPSERQRWRRVATLVALRTGDRLWRDSLVRHPEFTSNAQELMMVTAARLLQDGKDDQCQALLDQVSSPGELPEVPRRRYLSLRAKLAQLAGDTRTERIYIARLVETLGRWEKPECQACHANPRKFGEQVTTFDAERWWVGERFTALVKNDAERVRRESQDVLARQPDSATARLRLAYALRALGRDKEAQQVLKEIPWTESGGRERRAPLRLSQFP